LFDRTRAWKENPSENFPKKQGVFSTTSPLEAKKPLVNSEIPDVSEVFAHRGAHQSARENTLAAFQEARDLEVDGVEFDVRRSGDGALVVHHDPSAEGLMIAQTKARDLPTYVPLLGEALELLRGVKVNVEIKNLKDSKEPTYDDTGTFAHEVLEALREERPSLVSVSCFDRTTCEQLRSFDAEISIAWLIWRTSLSSALRKAREHEFNAVNPHFRLVTSATQREAHELGLDVNVWTVNRSRDLRSMAALEVTSIITDQPALALQLRGDLLS
jgi:glycerophosphoryl diester phosphodiesterase